MFPASQKVCWELNPLDVGPLAIVGWRGTRWPPLSPVKNPFSAVWGHFRNGETMSAKVFQCLSYRGTLVL